MNILIVGGVAGGATAAAKARRLSPDAKITILEKGPDISFANCGLPYFISGDITSRSKLILQSPESFNDQYSVQVHIETEAVAIDRQAKVVTAIHKQTTVEKTYPYDVLILAQGGRPIVPPLPGIEKDHVFSLWTLGDMDAIQAHIADNSPESAVVVGGGFIGLEMAEALSKRGLQVNIVERLPRVMPTFSPEISGFLQEELIAHGVTIHTSKAVDKIEDRRVVLGDGTKVSADMVLMSVGVRPTLALAEAAGLNIGDAGGLLVDEFLRTNDESIYAVGDMVEVEHRVSGKKVRIPLAGPANKQGRLAAENALGSPREYRGALGTSVVRVFDAVAGSTGLSLEQARAAGINADAVTVHKEHHTAYYPGATPVTVHLVYEKSTGTLLGGQSAGFAGADKRLDVIATAAAAKMTIHDLADLDLAYSPPIGTANDAMNMAAFAAENRKSGFSPSITVEELDNHIANSEPTYIDVRDVFAFEKGHIDGALNIPLTHLNRRISELPVDTPIFVYDEFGKMGHQALRVLHNAGIQNVTNISGGFTSVVRHERAVGFHKLKVQLPEIERKHQAAERQVGEREEEVEDTAAKSTGTLVIDVRTPEECSTGMYPGAINIPLDLLPAKIDDISTKEREIVLYCASGARSAYGSRILSQMGFSNVTDGGGIMDMMMNTPVR